MFRVIRSCSSIRAILTIDRRLRRGRVVEFFPLDNIQPSLSFTMLVWFRSQDRNVERRPRTRENKRHQPDDGVPDRLTLEQLMERGPRCLVALGYASSLSSVQVSALPQGKYNKAIKLDVVETELSYVIRTPHKHDDQTRADVLASKNIIDCIRRRLPDVPIGLILYATDFSPILRAPFTLAECMPGTRLYECFPTLSFEQKYYLVHEIVKVYASIWAVDMSAVGPICYDEAADDLGVDYDGHHRWALMPGEEPPTREHNPLPANVFDHMRERLYLLSGIPRNRRAARLGRAMEGIVDEVQHKQSWDGRVVLSHNDLMPRVTLLLQASPLAGQSHG